MGSVAVHWRQVGKAFPPGSTVTSPIRLSQLLTGILFEFTITQLASDQGTVPLHSQVQWVIGQAGHVSRMACQLWVCKQRGHLTDCDALLLEGEKGLLV